ncbi:hypothetical protein DC522_29785 [Microvirga sp. KLBC 81]|uniref:hypothetical protein n=1 Tax=Microvirga sp. KLBC 81 TaxID=1862707 RepID=UPI000D508E15|nr:hypothetical protein [Microvirga sp. KLBC 81]PVE20867.1 hypothetical protein DC522_29785 [Microvirga sp. KLBC 81]
MRRVLLVGCGSEIGVNLLLLNCPERDGFTIDTVITNSPAVDARYPSLTAIHGIYARALLAQPALAGGCEIVSESVLSFFGRKISFHFLNAHYDPFDELGRFDATILATSKQDAESVELNAKLRDISDMVLGVAESDRAPSIYPCLLGIDKTALPRSPNIASDGLYCIGSCQTNGMHASLRVVILAIAGLGFDARSIVSVETDIVHPDTPTGRLGTKSFEGRLQDCRDNLRPSFSQITKSIKKVMPWASMLNTVSLRAPVHAPGYQINRFIVRDDGKLTRDRILKACEASYTKHPNIVKATDLPLGSKAYAFEARCATILADDNHLLLHRPAYLATQGLVQITLQSFVSNTIGYSANVLSAVSYALTEKSNAECFP